MWKAGAAQPGHLCRCRQHFASTEQRWGRLAALRRVQPPDAPVVQLRVVLRGMASCQKRQINRLPSFQLHSLSYGDSSQSNRNVQLPLAEEDPRLLPPSRPDGIWLSTTPSRHANTCWMGSRWLLQQLLKLHKGMIDDSDVGVNNGAAHPDSVAALPHAVGDGELGRVLLEFHTEGL